MVMTGDELRKAYLDFFASKEHLIIPSAPLVPQDDPSILWINAGMAPFKPYFDGRKTPPRHRVSSCQKCIRTNDIDNVGKTDRHHTFFEMLGNFSFGDYFKKEAISWAWEFVTEVLKLEEDRLWITVYQNDDEAYELWQKVGVSKERILKMGKKDNFWEIGTGPCGPCSEIHYDRGEEYGTGEEDVVGGEGDRFLEIWNLVFTQYDKNEAGEYLPLPNKNIDTGMGLERVVSILQGAESNFETDLFLPLIDFIAHDTGIEYKRDRDTITAFRVIVDHIRSITMAIYDGVLPSNEGRGYVIRRILRRAVRYGSQLGYQDPFLYRLVPIVIENMHSAYPELNSKEGYIQKIVRAEEERFLQTLDQGLTIINEMISKIKEEKTQVLSGESAFKLYDTFGFPLDLTKDILTEKGLNVDEAGFEKEMEKQKRRARQAREDIGFSGNNNKIYSKIRDNVMKTTFIGYSNLENKTNVLALLKDGKRTNVLKAGEEGEIILENTPFYAESGGQVGDTGVILTGEGSAEVYDTKKKSELFVHLIKVKEGDIKVGQSVEARVCSERRLATGRNHSATHLLHKALKKMLGEHVNQAGSLVTPERLRFDFSHYAALSESEIKRIEEIVNQAIISNFKVSTIETDLKKAKELGATALFGEKYGEKVRVVSMGDFSKELCGGTHVKSTAEIGCFKILSESSIAAGVRRIEAITGLEVKNYIYEQDQIITKVTGLLKTSKDKLVERIDSLLAQQKELEKEIGSLKDRLVNSQFSDLLNQVEIVNGVHLLTAELDDLDNEELRKLSDQLKERLESGIIVLASVIGGKIIFVASITEDLVQKGYHAGKLIGRVAKLTGGGGGGRPNMAQAGGQKPEKIKEAFNEAKKIISNERN